MDPFKEMLKQLHADRRNAAVPGLLVAYVVIALSVAAVTGDSSLGVRALCFVAIGLMQYRLVMSCHEAVHHTLLFPRLLNETVGVLNGALVGVHLFRYRHQHLLHHRADVLSQDPDAYIYRPVLESPIGWPRFRSWVLGVPAEILEKFRQKGVSVGSNVSPEQLRRERGVSIVMLLVQAGLYLLFLRISGPFAYFVYWLGPVLAIALPINRTRVLIEHGYPVRLAAHGSSPLQTVDLVSSPVERFLFAPFCFNFHLAHHTVPSIPHYRLKDLSDLLRKSKPGYLESMNASYIGLLWQILFGGLNERVVHQLRKPELFPDRTGN